MVPLPVTGDKLGSTTIELERDGEWTLWVYHVVDGQRKPLREVAWIFADQDDESWGISVGGMGARPGKEEKGSLEIQIEQLDVTWR